ncbi:MAG TPA: Flp pilus assembly protein CpaB [Gaiellaceae bacterium]|nr:Flp pilus assembly protein CpaB [Gaiellaceae bacterium]
MSYRVRNIGVAVALALVAALMVTFYVSNFKRNVQAGEEPVTVYVASQNIPEGTLGAKVLDSNWLEKQEVERKNVTPGAISDPKQIEDAVATQPVYAGEQVTTLRFQSDSKRGLRAELSGNMRALQVPGDENQLLKGVLKEGDHVDIVASMKYKFVNFRSGQTQSDAPNGDELVASRVVLRDILVLRGPAAVASDQKLTNPNGGESTILAVTDSQAQKLFFVMKNADWSLQLRPTTDASDSPESVETVGSVLGDGLGPAQLRQLVFGRSVR